MKPLVRILFNSFLASTLLMSCNTTSKKDLLIGTWGFEKFEFIGELVDVPQPEVDRVNEANKGLTITFSSDNKISKKMDKEPNNNSSGTYSLLANDKIVIEGDTSKIIQLDKDYLKLYRNNLSPIII